MTTKVTPFLLLLLPLLVSVVTVMEARYVTDLLDDVRDTEDDIEPDERLLPWRRAIFDCRLAGKQCGILHHCCGSLQCYREEGLGLDFDSGVCVTCFNETQVCQRNKNCCDDQICDKPEWNDMNGVCSAPRKDGRCWEDEQCASYCKKEGLTLYGTCV